MNKTFYLLQGPALPNQKTTVSGHPGVSLGNLCSVPVTTETREGWHTVISVLQENSPTPPVNKVHKSTKQNQGQVTEDEAVMLHGSPSLLINTKVQVFQVPSS